MKKIEQSVTNYIKTLQKTAKNILNQQPQCV